jgi:acyl carrier protein
MTCLSPQPDGRDAILNLVIEAAKVLTQDWERAFEDPITPETMLVANLGCQSLDIVVLTADLSRQLHCHDLPFERLFLAEGKPVPDFSLETLADFFWVQMEARNRKPGGAAIRP